MCQIIFHFIIIALFSNPSFLFSKEISVSVRKDSLNEGIELGSRSIDNKYDRISSTLSYTQDNIYRYAVLNLNLNTSQTDYSKFYIKNSSGVIAPLSSETSVIEHTLNGSYGWYKNNYSFSCNVNLPISQKFYKTMAYGCEGTKNYFRSTTIFGAGIDLSNVQRPLSYFSNPENLELKKAPTEITNQSIRLFWEQVWSFKSKSRMTLFHKTKNQERPSNFGLKIDYARTLQKRQFLKLGYSYAQESTSDKLITDRGFFKNQTIYANYDYEMIYDFILSFSYDLMIENEHDPRTGRKSRIGLDQYGVGMSYLFSDYRINFQVSQFKSNVESHGMSYTGGFAWIF